jgi:putative flippase GtrA
MAVMVRLGYTPQQANIPSLAAGTVFQFLGNRYFVFKAQEGRVERQAAAFILCEAVAFGLNVAFFDWVSRQTDIHYTFIRLGTTFVVFAGFSYPLWHWIFRKEKISPRK